MACTRKAEVRGLCRRHYQAARYYIETGKTTEQELVDAGMLLAAYETPQSEYASMLAKLLKNPRRREQSPWKTKIEKRA